MRRDEASLPSSEVDRYFGPQAEFEAVCRVIGSYRTHLAEDARNGILNHGWTRINADKKLVLRPLPVPLIEIPDFGMWLSKAPELWRAQLRRLP